MSPEPSITCPRCGRTSHHPEDIRAGYCGACHDYTGAVASMVEPGLTFDCGLFYDRQGHEISLARWSYLSRLVLPDGAEYKRIAVDEVNLYRVSTIWIGIDHSFGFTGPDASGLPVIFETMLFLAGAPEDMGMQRYASEDEARAGHEAIVAEIRVLEQNAEMRRRLT